MDEIFIWGMKRSGIHAIARWIQHHIFPMPELLDDMDTISDRRNTSHNGIVTIFQHKDFRHCNIKQSAKNVIIIRDPFNYFASFLSHDALYKTIIKRNSIEATVHTWKIYANEVIGKTNYMPNKIIVNFNNWFSDKNYRKSISNQLGYDFTDAALNIVGPEGDGSSFDNTKYDGCAQNMDVLNRWKHLWKNDRKNSMYKEILSDKEIIDKSSIIFGNEIGT